ncbi:hypothetical protein TgHK011_004833 [Trichoderma gracile]|nr:hypothetical protein TgHK011_004833 [Trichoderma gracile]
MREILSTASREPWRGETSPTSFHRFTVDMHMRWTGTNHHRQNIPAEAVGQAPLLLLHVLSRRLRLDHLNAANQGPAASQLDTYESRRLLARLESAEAIGLGCVLRSHRTRDQGRGRLGSSPSANHERFSHQHCDASEAPQPVDWPAGNIGTQSAFVSLPETRRACHSEVTVRCLTRLRITAAKFQLAFMLRNSYLASQNVVSQGAAVLSS